ncbi:dienelactone hydrolase family protein [Roseibacterium sp. SDUM158017]|uniref:dienelactone hydrolase family protein n=1 Tax=Roseicyclus salinarum TaxID=3036773 RepID=UPI002415862B|nr:dienelactone hydrolase family protein [Roseibacterium sp. SDUM158017]MDG4650044.1 dienelactone hydrolase family protein [Roseibacterium sp. SDUM158017]
MHARSLIAATALAVAIAPLPLVAEVTGQYVTYTVNGTEFEGYVATDTAREPMGTVLIVHDWDGMTEYEESRARMLAEAGYTAFAIDVYGADTDPQGFEEYRALSGELYADRALFRERLMGSIAAAADIPGATGNMVMIGYCFGGAAVLEAARAGAALDGFVSFHGGLPTPEGQDWSMATGAPVMFFHGSADPVSGIADLAAVMDELVEAGIPHDARIYGGARHSFTVPGSDDYVEAAAIDSFAGLLEFLAEEI